MYFLYIQKVGLNVNRERERKNLDDKRIFLSKYKKNLVNYKLSKCFTDSISTNNPNLN